MSRPRVPAARRRCPSRGDNGARAVLAFLNGEAGRVAPRPLARMSHHSVVARLCFGRLAAPGGCRAARRLAAHCAASHHDPRRRPGRQETRLGDRGRDGLDAPRPFLRARRRRVAPRRPRATGAATRGVPGARGRPRREEPVQRVRRERADQDRDGGFTARERRARAVGAPRSGGFREVSRPLPAAEGDARRGGPAAATRGSIAHRTSSPGIHGSQPGDTGAGVVPPGDDAAARSVPAPRPISTRARAPRARCRKPRGLLLHPAGAQERANPAAKAWSRRAGAGRRPHAGRRLPEEVVQVSSADAIGDEGAGRRRDGSYSSRRGVRPRRRPG